MKRTSLRYFIGYVFGGAAGIAFCHTTSPLWMELLGAIAICFVAHRAVVTLCKE